MADKTDNLILDHLRAIRAELADLKDGQRDIKDEMIAVRGQLHAMQGDALRQERTIAGMQVNMDRINTRLNLTDEKQ